MSLLRKRCVIIAAIAIVVMPSAWLLGRDTGSGDVSIIAPVKRGDFEVTVTTSGELLNQVIR